MGLYDGERLVADWRLSTPPSWTGDEVAILLSDLFSLRGLELSTVTDVVIGSVVPHLTPGLEEASEAHLKVQPVVVGPGVKTGIRIAIENPKEVGADRIANTLAAFRKYGGPAIVIDLGTAVTYDAISAAGEYLGGAISPGVGISLDALLAHTAKLVRVELVPGIRSSVRIALRGACFGTMAELEGRATCVDTENDRVPVPTEPRGSDPALPATS